MLRDKGLSQFSVLRVTGRGDIEAYLIGEQAVKIDGYSVSYAWYYLVT
jgi:hypothetical protein